jgi:hypothetical protein
MQVSFRGGRCGDGVALVTFWDSVHGVCEGIEPGTVGNLLVLLSGAVVPEHPFASEEALSDAVLSLANLRQSPNLSVEGCANLIQRDASKLCGLVPEREQKRIFRKGLLPSCRRMVEALARHDDVPWAPLVRVALAGETSVPSNMIRLSGGRSAAVTQADVQRVESVNMTGWREPLQEQLAAMSGTDGGALPTTHGGHEELTFTDRVARLDDDEADMHAFLAEYDGRGRDRARSVCFL